MDKGKLNSTTTAQMFTTNSVVAITSGTQWTPGNDQVAFRVPQSISFFLGDSSDTTSHFSATVQAGMVTGVYSGAAYTFNNDFYIEVM